MQITRWLAAGSLAGLMLSHSAFAAEPLKIRQGWVNLTSIMAPLVFQKTDIMKHYGVTYTVEPIHFESSSAQLTALATGDVDITVGGPITLAHAVQNAKMDDIRVIADGFQDGVPGYFSNRYDVLNNSGIKDIDDLKGKVLVSNGIGGTMDVVIRAAMAKHHMTAGKDYTLIEAELGSMNSMLESHKVDLISSMPPFSYNAQLLAEGHPLFTMSDIVGPSEMTIIFARKGFLDKNKAALDDYFEDMQRGIHWFLDPANREAMLAIVAKATHQPADRFSGYLYTHKDFYHDPSARPNLATLQHDIETLRSLGLVKTELDVKKYADLGFIDRAEQRLKQAAN